MEAGEKAGLQPSRSLMYLSSDPLGQMSTQVHTRSSNRKGVKIEVKACGPELSTQQPGPNILVQML